MKKTLAALIAVATIAGSLAATPASAQRGVGVGIAAGLIGGAIVGGAIAPAARPMAVRSMWKKRRRPAAGFASASGTVTAGASAASRSATDLIGEIYSAFISKPGRCFGRVFLVGSSDGSKTLIAQHQSSAAPLRSASSPP